MAPQFIYVMTALRKVVPPSRVILDDIWLSFYPGAKIGVLGANGAGKSSLLRIMAGVDQDFQGEAWAAKGTKIGYLPQEPQLDESTDVRGNVEKAVASQRKLLDRFNEISAAFAEPDADFDKLMEEQARVQERIDTLDLWNLDNKIQIAMEALRLPPDDADVKTLSGGEKRRVALCRVLLEQPDMLLLDEPTNHLDAESVEWLAEQDTGEKVLQQEITIPPPPRLGNDVVIAKSVKKAFGDRVLFDDLTFALPRGGIVGVIGPNGAGKTTLFRMIVGEEQPDGGDLKVGETVTLAYVDQGRVLDGSKTAYQEVSEGRDEIQVGNREINARAYLSQFNFRGTDQQKKVGDLSGGERNRLHLAKLLKSGGNVLLLDEPTNDLDVDTLRGLEEALVDFAGCAVVISHDRWFLDRIATHILAFEGNSRVVWFEGNYQDYEADRRKRLGVEADQPHRIKYRKLVA